MKAEAELLEEALTKLRQGAPYSVAAVVVEELARPEADQVRWRTFVTDGRGSGFVDAEPEDGADADLGTELPAAYVERAVEYAAGRLSPESRLDELLAASPVAIPL